MSLVVLCLLISATVRAISSGWVMVTQGPFQDLGWEWVPKLGWLASGSGISTFDRPIEVWGLSILPRFLYIPRFLSRWINCLICLRVLADFMAIRLSWARPGDVCRTIASANSSSNSCLRSMLFLVFFQEFIRVMDILYNVSHTGY